VETAAGGGGGGGEVLELGEGLGARGGRLQLGFWGLGSTRRFSSDLGPDSGTVLLSSSLSLVG